MAIRDYRCKNADCAREFEYFHATSDDKHAQCSHCGTKETDESRHEKLFPKSTSFILKGGGWAKDRYGR
jgi:predicted nucleic acid-binding Zn ribbon protein